MCLCVRYTFGELAKAVSVRWKEMTVDDKAPFEEKAAADKARYTEAMKTYERPAHLDEGGDSDEGGGKKAKGKGKGKGKKKKKKDPNMPKKGLSAYMIFCKENRTSKNRYNIQCSEIFTLRIEKFRLRPNTFTLNFNLLFQVP